ncbi:hypothetical protein [Sandaracinus amylolyticus]|uniref:hypothetical protein n=1 Tax=Sandaracinus amylolyticus TaxID=927083 RepID=UPI0012EE95F5|nr:hypothetical protein [Sandaracinus amylolyticus]
MSARDERLGLAVWYPSRPTAAEWDQHLKDVEDVIGWSKKLGARPAIMLLANDFERPDARTRARLTELTGAPDYDPHVAFVNSNAMLRGVLTVFSWMHRSPNYEMGFLADEDAGVAWLEERRKASLPMLRTLLYEVRRKSGTAAPLR